ncbi:MAG: hypothetical protein Kow0090_11920 [Myxococcota bacterium]
MRFLKILSIISLLAAVSGCSMKKMAVRSTAEIIEDGMSAFNDEEDVELARAASASNLKLIEGLIRSDPENEKLLLAAAEGFCGFAFGFFEMDMERYFNVEDELYDKTRARAKIFYKRGLKYALKVIEDEYPEFPSLIEKGSYDEMKNLVANMDEEYLPALFWTGFCWGSIINLSRDDMGVVAALPKAKAIMERVMEIDPMYFHAGAYLFFAVLNSGMPEMLGGNPAEGKKYFEKAFEANGGKMLLANVFYARFYAVAVQDRGLYDKELEGVLSAPNDIFPGQTLYTMLAKERAKVLKERGDDFFID